MIDEPTSFDRLLEALGKLAIDYFVLPTSDIAVYYEMELTAEQETKQRAAKVYIAKRDNGDVWIFVGQHRGKSFDAERMKTLVTRLEAANDKQDATRALLDIPQ